MNSFAQDASGNIFIGGYIEDSNDVTSYSSILIKTDSLGNLIWKKHYEYSSYRNDIVRILPAVDGSLYVVGKSNDNYSGLDPYYWEMLMKLNASGAIIWSHTYTNSYHSSFSTEALPASDGTLMVSGWCQTLNGSQVSLAKYDTTGTKIWDKRWLGGFERGTSSDDMTYTNNGGYMLFGSEKRDSGKIRIYFIECDSSGNMLNLMRYGFSYGAISNFFLNLRSVHTTDGGYAAAGIMYVDFQPQKLAIVLLKVDSNLIPQWSMVYDTGYVNALGSLLQTPDGGYLIAGSQGDNILLIKTDANGMSLCNEQTLPVFYYHQSAPYTYFSASESQNPAFVKIPYHPVVSTVANTTLDTFCYSSTCPAPTGEYTDAITNNSAKVHWQGVSAANKYKVHYRITGTNTWTKTSTVNTYKKLKNLSPNTQYDWEVKSICTDLDLGTSDWSATQNFTTLPMRSGDEESVSLFGVYPNPFSSTATIAFSLEENSHTTIELFDLTGRKIKTLVDENLESGNHEVQLNRGQLSSGVYFLQLQTSTYMVANKVLIE